MIYEVESKAELCRFNFACLHDPDFTLCKIERCIDKQVYFVEKDDRYCTYAKSFGNAFYCTCPIRKEIYNKYKV